MFLFHLLDPILPTFFHKPKHCERTHKNLYNIGMHLPKKIQYEMGLNIRFLKWALSCLTICKLDPRNKNKNSLILFLKKTNIEFLVFNFH